MLLGKSFDEISAETVIALVEASATESAQLDFKQSSYGSSDDEKRELLKDISSFANTLGGYLILGLGEKEGVASHLSPLTGIDVDKELLRLENVCRTGIESPIVGLRMKRLDVAQGAIIVISVPRSFNPPHRVVFRGSNRFYARNSAGVYELALEELRALFGERHSIEERAKYFLGERLNRLTCNEGFVPLPMNTGLLVFHLIPLQDFGLGRRIDISTICKHQSSFPPIDSSGYSRLINLDGCCLHHGDDPKFGYTQVFRDGSVEAITSGLVYDYDDERRIASLQVANYTFEVLEKYLSGLRELGASPPFLFQISAIEIANSKIAVDQNYSVRRQIPNQQRTLRFPISVIPEFRPDGNYEDVVFEQMNYFWNAFGYERCLYFDAEGNWTKRKP